MLYECQICKVRYELKDTGEKIFYWSHKHTQTTAGEVAARVCQYLTPDRKTTQLALGKQCANALTEPDNSRGWMLPDGTNPFVVPDREL